MDQEEDYYGEDGGYNIDEDPYGEEPEEDIEANVEIDFYEAEGLIRNGQIPEAVVKLEQLYKLSEENSLRNWKPKILNHLLDLSCREKDSQKITSSLENILKLHQSEKLTDTAIKSIITTLKTLDEKLYKEKGQFIMSFFSKLDPPNTMKGYLFMLQNALADKDKKTAIELLKKAELAASKIPNIAPDELLNLYSLEVKVSQASKIDITPKLRKMQLKLSYLENEAYMNDGSLSIIKQALAQIHYKNQNYKVCSEYLCQAFQEYVRYGKNSGLKQLLKRTALVSLLCDDMEITTSSKNNPLYHESSSPFKSDNDIFSLYSFIEAFQDLNEKSLKSSLQAIALVRESPYDDLQDRIIQKLREQKLIAILGAYQRVKLTYLQKRIGLKSADLENTLFQLIANEKIRASIHRIQGYIEVLPPVNQYLTTQLANIQELSVRY